MVSVGGVGLRRSAPVFWLKRWRRVPLHRMLPAALVSARGSFIHGARRCCCGAMLLRSAPVGVVPVLAKADFAEVRLSTQNSKPSLPPQIPATGMMEITLPGSALIRVDAAVDGAALGRVLAALTGR